MGLHSEEDVTFAYQTTRHPIAIHIPTLAMSTAHSRAKAKPRSTRVRFRVGVRATQTFLAGTHNFTPDEIETFYETT